MNTRGTDMRQIALMTVGCDEVDQMCRLNTLWAMTMDLQHDNVLAYPEDVIVEKLDEIYPRKYINLNDFSRYESEDGAPWLISKSLHIEDIDAFFRLYLHLDEQEAAA